MSIEKYLALLKQGVEVWNEWRAKNPTIPNLRQANLSKAELSATNLSWADLTQSNLSQTNLGEANLRWANLSQANLKQATLTKANLRQANLNQADLSQANLSNADLRGANLNMSNLSRADLSQADLSGQERSNAVLVGANLKDANLYQANLSEANLSRADLSRANCSEANLSNADLSRAILNGVDLRGTNLRGTDLSGTNLRRTNLVGVDLQGTNLSGTDLREANLIRANLSGANLTGANLTGANLLRTQALGTNFTQASLIGVSLEECLTDEATNFTGAIWDENGLAEQPSVSLPASEPHPTHPDAAIAATTDPAPQLPDETFSLKFTDGIDWKALLLALEDLQVMYSHERVVVQAIENDTDESVLIRLDPPEGVPWEEFETYAIERYQAQLNALEVSYRQELKVTDDEIVSYRQQSTNLLEMVKLQAKILTRVETPPPETEVDHHAPAIASDARSLPLSEPAVGAQPDQQGAAIALDESPTTTSEAAVEEQAPDAEPSDPPDNDATAIAPDASPHPASDEPLSPNVNSDRRRAILDGLEAYEPPAIDRVRRIDDAFEAPNYKFD